ncbi:glucose-6-phosphate dehydrogenase assembly protein OpcA [Corynebacterium fournieri]|uniref:glucose-6-phosphate dehydrogenase assembly protein OpcA n=1 Tax=Corynebacterium fournieri TaxID=1852390 RepID=UPI000A2EDC5D|nr:glucose-6-phosphate dehydrogenase assembly protein OpcA [Corynebacterium fournieri]WJY97631.1 Glucose-6-phosphate dehydrogenase subunit [Corynebacterium fournieri]
MITDLPDTTTKAIAAELACARDRHSLATGRVLTLLVAVDDAGAESIDETLAVLRDASFEHPARVLVLINGDAEAETRLDAQVLVATDVGASEVVVMRLYGELTAHLGAVVTPLLLPDTPVVACWPQKAPQRPSLTQLGRIAQRRITNLRRGTNGVTLEQLTQGYAPGDSDMMWSRITPWRGIVASALDRHPGARVLSAKIAGATEDPSVDLAAGWLASSLGVKVTRLIGEASGDFPIDRLVLHCEGGDVEVAVQDHNTVRISAPGNADSLVAMGERTEAESLAEDLRHLGPDSTYERALRGLSGVHNEL